MFDGIKAIKLKNIPHDILSGIIIALVSIPISMGYAQIAGLPAVYGLYGSVLPVLVFALISSSPQYIFGVDAAPAALVGGTLATLGITASSKEAMSIVPIISFYTGIWLMLFFIFKVGRLTEYVSTPVMGGFISGICATIILMQIPKLFGGVSGTGEIHQLILHIISECRTSFSLESLILGLVCIVIILTSKRLAPKLPMSVIIMGLGAGLEYLFHFAERFGIATLPAVEGGLGHITMPDFSLISPIKAMGLSLTIAVVIMAETLLAENSFAMRNGYRIHENNEIAAFACGNIVACLIGCCPVNGSVSRTAMNEQFKGKSQLTSLVAVGVMAIILMFCTGFIQYLPIPVLTAIVICALLGAIELDIAKKLAKINKKEFLIFIAAFLGVLVLGTIYGVVIGVILSFVNIIIRESNPPRNFVGVITGRGGFFDLEQNSEAREIQGAVIYKFRSNLFFANVKEFREDIEGAIKDDTRCVIVDASGITSIDTTGADTLESIYNSLKDKGIKFYLAEHSASVNDLLRSLGLEYIIEEGSVRRTISAALRAQGYTKPYPLYLKDSDVAIESYQPNFKEQLLHEFEWAFGDKAQAKIDEYAEDILKKATKANLDNNSLLELTNLWKGLGSFDEDILLETLEIKLSQLSQNTGMDEDEIARRIEEQRDKIYQFVKVEDEDALTMLQDQRQGVMNRVKDESPELYKKLNDYHEEYAEQNK